MFGRTHWTPFDDIFNFQREADRLFDRFWSDLPARAVRSAAPAFQVYANEDAWTVEVPLPGVDPQHVTLDVAGQTLSLRVQEPETNGRQATRIEQTLTAPRFLDLDRLTATHRHGMLVLTLPIKEAVKPRRIPIGAGGDESKDRSKDENRQLTAA